MLFPDVILCTIMAICVHIAPAEMGRTFNCGIGMVVVADADRAGDLERVLTEAGETVTRVGRIVRRGGPAVVLGGMEDAWRA